VRGELAPPAVRKLALLAELYDPPAALELGLVDELAAPEGVLDRALEVAAGLASLPKLTYRAVKAQVRRDTLAEIERVLSGGADPMVDAFEAGEMPAAAAAVLRGGS
jgi:enoyl-CoA hydratase/carnithine racemase